MDASVVQEEENGAVGLNHVGLHPQKPSVENGSRRPRTWVTKIVHEKARSERSAFPCTTETSRSFRLRDHEEFQPLITGSVTAEHDCDAVYLFLDTRHSTECKGLELLGA